MIEDTVATISRERPGTAWAVTADLTKDADRARCVEEAVGFLGSLDILVNAAGILQGGSLEANPIEHFDRTMDINVRSVYDLTRAALPHIMKSKGNIVNVSSVAGLRPYAGLLAYCVSKAAVDQMTRCLALELAPGGVRVNAVNPGVVVTSLHRTGGMSEEAYAAFLERGKETHPLGRVGTADEVAESICWLASDRAGWITGTTMSVDGGRALASAR
jgi:NAD(P)-dependent dehydrogenase (short-subunit alcohol dehydrogenase family)